MPQRRHRVRDLTHKQYVAAVLRAGWTFGALGYVDVGEGYYLYAGNAGSNRRARLAYLQARADQYAAKTERRVSRDS